MPAHLGLADLEAAKSPARAAAILESAIQIVPERAYLAFERLARLYAAAGEPSRFAALCERIIAHDPRDWRARLQLARHARAEGRPEEGRALLLRALESNPQVLLAAPRDLAHAGRAGSGGRRGVGLRGHRRAVVPVPRPARVHGLPLSRRRHVVAVPALPRVGHVRRGAGRARRRRPAPGDPPPPAAPRRRGAAPRRGLGDRGPARAVRGARAREVEPRARPR